MKNRNKYQPLIQQTLRILLLLPLLLSGCASFPSLDFNKDHFITANGRGVASSRSFLVNPTPDNSNATGGSFYRRRPAAVYPQWSNEVLKQKTSAPIPSDTNSRVEAQLLARRRAFDNALLVIAQRINQLPTPEDDGRNVKDMLELDANVADKLTKVLRSSIQITQGNSDQNGNYILQTQLALEPIALLLWGEPQLETYPRKTVGAGWTKNVFSLLKENQPPDILDQQAYENAHRDATQKMLQAIQGQTVYPGVTIEHLMRVDPGSREFVLEEIANTKVTEVQYPQPGICDVQLRLNVKKLMEQLKE